MIENGLRNAEIPGRISNDKSHFIRKSNLLHIIVLLFFGVNRRLRNLTASAKKARGLYHRSGNLTLPRNNLIILHKILTVNIKVKRKYKVSLKLSMAY